jgi:DNA-binding HxlR family transcriptional regulator
VIKNGRYQFTEDCDRVTETLRRIGDKWSVLIIVLVELGPRRFNDLKRSIPLCVPKTLNSGVLMVKSAKGRV